VSTATDNTNTLDDAFRQRDLAVILAAQLAHTSGLRAGRYVDPHAAPPFQWVVQIDLLGCGQVTWHVHADAEGGSLVHLPIIPRTWDGHDKVAGEAAVRSFVAMRTPEPAPPARALVTKISDALEALDAEIRPAMRARMSLFREARRVGGEILRFLGPHPCEQQEIGAAVVVLLSVAAEVLEEARQAERWPVAHVLDEMRRCRDLLLAFGGPASASSPSEQPDPEAEDAAAIAPPKSVHWCHGFNCCGVPWPAGKLDVGMPHPRDCLADPSTWPAEAAKPGQLQAKRRADGRVEVRNPGGRVLTVSTWTMQDPEADR
jgi:hypothetical protein